MSIEVLQDNLCVNRLIEGKKKEITLEYNFDGKPNHIIANCLDCSKCNGYNPWKNEDQRNIYKILTERQKKDGKGTTVDTKV